MATKRDNVAHTRAALLDAAGELFYRDGIAATSVDTVVAHASLSKPTFYRHFQSKDALVAAYLDGRSERQMAALEAVLTRQETGSRERLLAVFDWLDEWITADDFRGCGFARASAEMTTGEAPIVPAVRRHKLALRKRLRALAREAKLAIPVQVGDAIMLLVEGALTTAFLEGDRQAARKAKRVAKSLLTLLPAAS